MVGDKAASGLVMWGNEAREHREPRRHQRMYKKLVILIASQQKLNSYGIKRR